MNLPDPKQRLRHVIAILAIIVLGLLCLSQKWLWAFYLTALLNLMSPAWRAQLFRPAGSLAGFFVLASLLIFAIPIGCLFWAFTESKAFDLAPPSLIMEAIFVATISIAGLFLSRRHPGLNPVRK